MNKEDTKRANECLANLEAIKGRLNEEGIAERKWQDEQKRAQTARHTGADPEGYAGVMLGSQMEQVFGDRADKTSYTEVLRELTEAVMSGDESCIQRTLTVQMLVMNKAFMDMVNLMEHNADINGARVLGELAAKFQNQSRRTAATLVDIKRPRQKTYIRQANVAENQLINNNGESSTEIEITENEESGEVYVQALERSSAQAAIGVDSPCETLAELNRPQDSRGQREVEHECIEDR